MTLNLFFEINNFRLERGMLKYLSKETATYVSYLYSTVNYLKHWSPSLCEFAHLLQRHKIVAADTTPRNS